LKLKQLQKFRTLPKLAATHPSGALPPDCCDLQRIDASQLAFALANISGISKTPEWHEQAAPHIPHDIQTLLPSLQK
jgi:hypothetical protein